MIKDNGSFGIETNRGRVVRDSLGVVLYGEIGQASIDKGTDVTGVVPQRGAVLVDRAVKVSAVRINISAQPIRVSEIRLASNYLVEIGKGRLVFARRVVAEAAPIARRQALRR